MKRLIIPSGWRTWVPFQDMFELEVLCPQTELDKDCVMLFESGTDISPIWYNERQGKHTQHPDITRDALEMKLSNKAVDLKIPSLGICRGAQLLCVAAGGALVQHIEGHDRPHPITTNDQVTFIATSCHHQMMFPKYTEHKMLAWASVPRSSMYLDENDKEVPDITNEPEIVWFPTIKGLAIQGHPEWSEKKSPYVKYCRDLVLKYLIEETA